MIIMFIKYTQLNIILHFFVRAIFEAVIVLKVALIIVLLHYKLLYFKRKLIFINNSYLPLTMLWTIINLGIVRKLGALYIKQLL